MLEHEPLKETDQHAQPQQQNPASDTRVTAEEFAAAIDALEKRKAEEANRLAGTVAIGETLRELRVDATPEEILKEVELQRARAAAEALRIKAASAARAKMAADAFGAVRDGVRGAFGPRVGPVQSYRPVNEAPAQTWHGKTRSHRGWWGAVVGPIAFAWFMFSLMSGHIFQGFPFSSDSHHHGSGGPFEAVSQLQDGNKAWVSTDNVVKLLQAGGKLEGTTASLQVSTSRMDNGWEIIDHKGQLYLHGFILERDHDPNLGQETSFKLFNDNNSGDLHGESDQAVTLPLAGAELSDHSQLSQYSDIDLDATPDYHYRDHTDQDVSADD